MCPVVPFFLGALASCLSLAAAVPQVVRALRGRSVEGLSWTSTVMSLGTMTVWCVYAVAVADKIQVVNNVVAFGLLVALAAAVVRAGGTTRTWSPFVVVVASACLALLVLGVSSAFTLAMCATTLSSLRMVPQTRLALSGVPLWGLDPWATVLSWAGMALWMVYGALVGDAALAVCSAIMLVMQTLILAMRLPPRRTLGSLAGGRLGTGVARLTAPLADRFPERPKSRYELAA
jgi:uncharacterized protein with PQ loop repeat